MQVGPHKLEPSGVGIWDKSARVESDQQALPDRSKRGGEWRHSLAVNKNALPGCVRMFWGDKARRALNSAHMGRPRIDLAHVL